MDRDDFKAVDSRIERALHRLETPRPSPAPRQGDRRATAIPRPIAIAFAALCLLALALLAAQQFLGNDRVGRLEQRMDLLPDVIRSEIRSQRDENRALVESLAAAIHAGRQAPVIIMTEQQSRVPERCPAPPTEENNGGIK